MKEIKIDSVQAFNDFFGFETLHPLVSVVRFDPAEAMKRFKFAPSSIQKPLEPLTIHYGIYAVILKETKGCALSYGRTPYDFDEMTVTPAAPGYAITVEPVANGPAPRWTALVFHPDFLKMSALGQQMSRYEFFSYSLNEALHLSAQEIEIYRSVVGMIDQELHHAIDPMTHDLIINHIEMLLNYCLRFYGRQFITRKLINHSVVQKFEALLRAYIYDVDTQTGLTKTERQGLPTVAYFAEKCCLSTSYFGTLVKTETGRTAKDIINDLLLAKAKELLNSYETETKQKFTVAQVSDRLGFEYPQHFVRFFKALTGMTPTQWRAA